MTTRQKTAPANYPFFSDRNPPTHRYCGGRTVPATVHKSTIGNKGRPYWKCPDLTCQRSGNGFAVWKDSRGINPGNPRCYCQGGVFNTRLQLNGPITGYSLMYYCSRRNLSEGCSFWMKCLTEDGEPEFLDTYEAQQQAIDQGRI